MLLVVLAYGYHYVTDGNRVRKLAKQYLTELTGGSVSIRSAEFNLFGDIKLNGVTVSLPSDNPKHPFFQARTVSLEHKPWSLIATGQVHPTRIVCDEPEVQIDHDAVNNFYPAQKYFESVRGTGEAPTSSEPVELPTISVRKGTLRFSRVVGDVRTLTKENHVDLVMEPSDAMSYKVMFDEKKEGHQEPVRLTFDWNLADGKLKLISGGGSTESISGALPQKYSEWLERFRISAGWEIESKQLPSGKDIYEVKLNNMSATLPLSFEDSDSGDGLALTGVNGVLAFDEDGVTLKNIVGRFKDMENATVSISSGRYMGFDTNSPLEIELVCSSIQMPLPIAEHARGMMADILRDIRDTFNPEGPMTIRVKIKRLDNGKVLYSGSADLEGDAITYKELPYRLEDVRGQINFTADKVSFKDVTGRRGDARFEASGQLSLASGEPYDVTVMAEHVSFDENLRKALPPGYLSMWNELSPSGQASVALRYYRRPGQSGRSHITITADGGMAFAYAGFPYRVEHVVGQIRVDDDKIAINSIKGSRGSTKCSINGVIENAGDDETSVDLTIDASNLPLDERLEQAIPESSRSAYKSLSASGLAESVNAKVTQQPGESLNYSIKVALKDVRFVLDMFPYEVTDASGALTIEPQRIIVENLEGRHENTKIIAGGLLFTGGNTLGMDMNVEATNVVLDEAFKVALPPNSRQLWEDLSPTGRADMVLSVQRNSPENPGELDYSLLVEPTEMSLKYKHLPFEFRNITGKAIIRPGRIELRKVSAASGNMTVTLDGRIISSEDKQWAELSFVGTEIPITRELLDSLPEEFDVLKKRFKPGGKCDIDISKFLFARRPLVEKKTEVAVSATQPIEAEDYDVTWSMHGKVKLADASIDIGLSTEKLTGTIEGSFARSSEGVAVKADMAFDKIKVGDHTITDLEGRFIKNSRSTLLQFEDLSGKLHGGRLAGLVHVRLGDPVQYGLRLDIENIKLEELIAASIPDLKKRPDVKGLLTGTVEFTTIGNDPTKRRAKGVLKIEKGKMYKLPVMLGALNVVYLAMPSKEAFDEGEVRYELLGDKLIFNEIFLSGSALSVVGSGTVNTRTQSLNLNFLAGPPGKVPRLPALAEELLEPILRELLEIQVTGTVANPKRRSVSLRSLDEALRRLVSPSIEEE